MRVTAIVPTLGRAPSLEATLQSLLRCEPPPHELVVVDGDANLSASEVVTALACTGGAPAMKYVESAPGLTVQRNVGIAQSSGDVVVFLDDDVVVPAHTFTRLDDVYSDPTIVGATGRVLETMTPRLLGVASPIRRLLPGGGVEGGFTRFGYPRYVQDVEREQDVAYMPGCFMSARRDVAVKVGFDENLTGYALAEDEDFSFRLSRQGRIRYLPDIVVEHRKLGFGSKDPREFGRMVVRNRRYLFKKNFDSGPLARVQFALFVLGLVAHRVVNREWRGAQGILEGTFGDRWPRP